MKFATGVVAFLALVYCAKAFNWTQYYDVEDIHQYLRDMEAKHPNNAKVIDLGNSYEKRPLLGLKISGNKSAERSIMIESGIHAREWIVPAASTYLINQLLTSKDSDIRELKNAVDWYIFPSVNPDGYQYSRTTNRLWRKTRSPNKGQNSSCYGTDGNRNFNYHWNTIGVTDDPCANNYPGPKVFSEIEFQHLSKFIRRLGDKLIAYISLHAPEQAVYVPYGDSKKHIKNYDDMIKAAKKFLSYAAKVNGTQFAGPANVEEISYGASGMSPDWVYHTLGTNFTYTIEIRSDNNFSWPANLISVQGDEFTQMMLGLVDGIKELGYL